MQVSRQDFPDHTVLAIEGPILIGESARKFYDLMNQILDTGVSCILFDFRGVDYIDSTGLGELVGFLERLRGTSARLALVQPRDRVLKLLQVTGLDRVFPIFDSVAAARAHLGLSGET
ncbi:MAG: STAS domain-containing protein [Acidobacteria bacterium]|nr:STAS domain-containing protein [Acidobacteriota bacterium]MDW7984785.1 STAS domain-containing protein [Acidobacteriota bacterium]